MAKNILIERTENQAFGAARGTCNRSYLLRMQSDFELARGQKVRQEYANGPMA